MSVGTMRSLITSNDVAQPLRVRDVPRVVETEHLTHPLDVFKAYLPAGFDRRKFHEQRIAWHQADQAVDEERDQEQR
jgi:hypothetical protein